MLQPGILSMMLLFREFFAIQLILLNSCIDLLGKNNRKATKWCAAHHHPSAGWMA
jgi:hypothetical protein